MSQIGSITAEKEKQMALERQKFQEAKAKMLAQQKYKRAARITGHIALNIVVALIVLLPLLYAISIAFMPSSELFTLDLNILPKHPTLENFRQALQKVPLVRFVINSFLVAGLITFGQIISCSLAAFSFSFLDFKGKNVLFMLVMATMMIPGEATIISNYLTVSSWNWLDSYQVLIVPYLTSAMGIFLFRQFYLTFPISLYESAKIDGCSNLRFIWQILMPLTKSAMGGVNGEALDYLVNKFNEENEYGITVDSQYQGSYDDAINKLKSAQLGNMGADLVQVYDIGTRFMIDSGLADFSSGKAAITLGSTASLKQILQDVNGSFEVGTAYFPSITDDDKGGVSIGGASLWMLDNQDDAKKAATWEFVKYLVSAESQAYWNAQTGYFPVTTAAHDEQVFKDNIAEYPQFRTAIDQLHDSAPEYAGALLSVFPEARSIVETEIENMLNGKQSAEDAVSKMASDMNKSIEDYNLLNE